MCLFCLHLKYLLNFISFSWCFPVNLNRLVTVAGNVVELIVIVVLSRHGCKVHKNCKLVGITLVISVVARVVLVDLVIIESVF